VVEIGKRNKDVKAVRGALSDLTGRPPKSLYKEEFRMV